MAHTLDCNRLDEVFEKVLWAMDELNQWEQGFIDSVHEQWTRSGSLSEAQLTTLEKIYLKVP